MNKNKPWLIPSIILAVFTFIGALVYTLMSVIPSSPYPSIKEEIARIKKSGEPVSIADIIEDKIPDSENAAIIYAKAFNIIKTPQAQNDIRTIVKLIDLNKQSGVIIPPAEVIKIISLYKNVFNIADAAAKRPKCQYPIDWSKGPLYIEYPHLKYIRDLSRLLAANAIICAHKRDMNGAVNSLVQNYRIADSIKDEPTFVSFLCRLSIDRFTTNALLQIVQTSNLTQQQCKELYSAIAPINYYDEMKYALCCERAMGIEIYTDICENGFNAAVLQANASKNTSSAPKRKSSLLMRYFIGKEELFYLTQMAMQIKAAGKPYPKSHYIFPDKKDFPRYSIFGEILFPVVMGTFITKDEDATYLAIAQLSLALQAYESRYNSYPTNINELNSKLKWKLPKDPFNGKDLVYKKQAQGYIIYSIGPDMKDNNGRPVKGQARIDTLGDIVWSCTKKQ